LSFFLGTSPKENTLHPTLNKKMGSHFGHKLSPNKIRKFY
jgi:hypothetical protein